MALISAKCTHCGANIKIDESKEAGVCEHCGTAFITEKAINNYVTNNISSNTYHTNQNITKVILGNEKDEAEDLIHRGDVQLSLEDYAKAAECFQKAADINPASVEAYIGLAKALAKDFKDFPECIAYIQNQTKHYSISWRLPLEKAFKVATGEQKYEIEKMLEKYNAQYNEGIENFEKKLQASELQNIFEHYYRATEKGYCKYLNIPKTIKDDIETPKWSLGTDNILRINPEHRKGLQFDMLQINDICISNALKEEVKKSIDNSMFADNLSNTLCSTEFDLSLLTLKPGQYTIKLYNVTSNIAIDYSNNYASVPHWTCSAPSNPICFVIDEQGNLLPYVEDDEEELEKSSELHVQKSLKEKKRFSIFGRKK